MATFFFHDPPLPIHSHSHMPAFDQGTDQSPPTVALSKMEILHDPSKVFNAGKGFFGPKCTPKNCNPFLIQKANIPNAIRHLSHIMAPRGCMADTRQVRESIGLYCKLRFRVFYILQADRAKNYCLPLQLTSLSQTILKKIGCC